ncbi:MAG: helix-turn-helix domain-containing protein [Acutalibacteraceae bacterium]
MDNTQMAETIKQLCKTKKITVKSLLDICDINRNFMYDLKNNKKPSVEILEKIADYFNVSIDYLLGRTNTPKFENNILVKESVDKAKLIDNINQLNNDGIKKILDYSNDLISSGNYKEKTVTVVVAARSQNNDFPVQQMQIPKSKFEKLLNVEEDYDENL